MMRGYVSELRLACEAAASAKAGALASERNPSGNGLPALSAPHGVVEAVVSTA